MLFKYIFLQRLKQQTALFVAKQFFGNDELWLRYPNLESPKARPFAQHLDLTLTSDSQIQFRT